MAMRHIRFRALVGLLALAGLLAGPASVQGSPVRTVPVRPKAIAAAPLGPACAASLPGAVNLFNGLAADAAAPVWGPSGIAERFLTPPQIAAYLGRLVDHCRSRIAPADVGVGAFPAPGGQHDKAQVAINAALAANARAGKWTAIPAGHYRLTAPILMPSGGRLIADHNAVFYHGDVPGFGGPGMGRNQAMVEAAGMPTARADDDPCPRRGKTCSIGAGPGVAIQPGRGHGANDVEVIGGTWRGMDPGADFARRDAPRRVKGKVMQWFGNNWSLTGLYINGWGQAPVPSVGVLWVGNAARLQHIVMRDPVEAIGYACLRNAGGKGAHIAYTDLHCGDDAWAIGPLCRSGNGFACKFAEVNVSALDATGGGGRVVIENGRARSFHARVFAIGNYRIGGSPYACPAGAAHCRPSPDCPPWASAQHMNGRWVRVQCPLRTAIRAVDMRNIYGQSDIGKHVPAGVGSTLAVVYDFGVDDAGRIGHTLGDITLQAIRLEPADAATPPTHGLVLLRAGDAAGPVTLTGPIALGDGKSGTLGYACLQSEIVVRGSGFVPDAPAGRACARPDVPVDVRFEGADGTAQ